MQISAMVLCFEFLLFSSLPAVLSQSPTLFPAIITFGDSTVDVGNNNHLPAMFKADFLPYGRDFSTHLPTGRFCDGKLVTDFTAETLGFTSFPPAYLSEQASGKSLLLGANFASAGSGYCDNTSIKYNAITMSQQLEYYKEYRVKLARMAGKTRAESILSTAMHIVSTGNGDYVQNYYINPSLYRTYTADEFSSLLISNLSSFIKELYGLGARKIGVTTLPPLGCLPAAINLFGHGRSNSCISRFNKDAQGYNLKLSTGTGTLEKQLPNLKIAVFDIYKPLLELATYPSKYGFTEARKGCCGTGTSETTVLCKPNSPQICQNASEYVFWDGVHPSQAANMYISQSIFFEGVSLLP